MGSGSLPGPPSVDALKDPHVSVRWWAADALAQIGPAAAKALPALVDALKDPHELVRRSAADALAQIGPAAAGAMPALIATLKSNGDRHSLPRWVVSLLRQSGVKASGQRSSVVLRTSASNVEGRGPQTARRLRTEGSNRFPQNLYSKTLRRRLGREADPRR